MALISATVSATVLLSKRRRKLPAPLRASSSKRSAAPMRLRPSWRGWRSRRGAPGRGRHLALLAGGRADRSRQALCGAHPHRRNGNGRIGAGDHVSTESYPVITQGADTHVEVRVGRI